MSNINDWDQATIEEADAYLLARGTDAEWALATDVKKTQALQRAWDYLCGLSWYDNVFDDELPDNVKYAQIVGASKEIASVGILLPSLTSDDYLISKDIAGVIKKEYRLSAPTSIKFTEIEVLLSGYKLSNVSIELQRG